MLTLFLQPNPNAKPNAEVFFQSYLAAPVVLILYVSWKSRSKKWRFMTPLSEIDLKTDLKEYDMAEDDDSTVGQSPWRRFGKWLC